MLAEMRMRTVCFARAPQRCTNRLSKHLLLTFQEVTLLSKTRNQLIENIITERVDDIPLLLEQMQRMGLPTLLDAHFPTHGNWQGLSLGWVTTIWLSSILSRGDHRLVHVEPWVANRLWTLRATTGQAVERLDFTDDRLEIVLRGLHDDTGGPPLNRT
jgi:hypothetical protein